ncbi:MAG: hypothetical protein A2020_15950 [Lentisphaerae bacterium GWF2_45_14]|nr:MAG: hypothetical protein A2020_15950 [Lentisphaerae bacterium GWF2_45_14]
MKKKRLTIFLTVFLFAEAFALLIGFWPFFFNAKPETRRALRLGIVPEISEKKSVEEWSVFFSRFENERLFKVLPYFASSGEEAVNGLAYGSLDMLYTDAGVYLVLKGKLNSRAIAYQMLDAEEKEKNRAILVAGPGRRYLSQLKGARLILTEKNSLSGSIMPSLYLSGKLKKPLKDCFSSVSYSVSQKNSLEMLKSGQADVIALNFMQYTQLIKDFPELDGDYSVIWMSPVLPSPLICTVPTSPLADTDTVKNFEKELEKISAKRKYNLNFSSKIFAPVDFEYKKELAELEKLFDEYKDNTGGECVK